jgi:hypothetical protein
VDGDGGLESLGGFPGKGSAKPRPPKPQPIPLLPPGTPGKRPSQLLTPTPTPTTSDDREATTKPPAASSSLTAGKGRAAKGKAAKQAQPPASVDLVDGALAVAYKFYCMVQVRSPSRWNYMHGSGSAKTPALPGHVRPTHALVCLYGVPWTVCHRRRGLSSAGRRRASTRWKRRTTA